MVIFSVGVFINDLCKTEKFSFFYKQVAKRNKINKFECKSLIINDLRLFFGLFSN